MVRDVIHGNRALSQWKSSVQTTARSIIQVTYEPVCKIRFYIMWVFEYQGAVTWKESATQSKPRHSVNWAPLDRDSNRGSGATLLFLGSESMTTARRIAIVGASWDRRGSPQIDPIASSSVRVRTLSQFGTIFDPTYHVNATALNQASPQVVRTAEYEIEKGMKMSETRTEHRQYCIIKANTIY